MMQKMDGMNYAPVYQGTSTKVVAPNEFLFSVIGLDHGHIFAMVNGLLEAGATLKAVFDTDTKKAEDFCSRYPQCTMAPNEQSILDDSDIKLVVSAIRPDLRAGLGIRVMQAGKDYFVDKPGMLDTDSLVKVQECITVTQKKYIVYFGERVHVEGAVYVQKLIEDGVLGEILNVIILAPHRLNKENRPQWFFDPAQNGGIICDIGSHQIEQFLSYTHATDATVTHSNVANFANQDHPEFQDFGDISLVSDTGATGYVRIDWFTPDGLGAWGDGRVFIVGTKATVEIRKYINVATDTCSDHVFLVDAQGEHHQQVTGTVGFPFFGQLILDCINRTEQAIKQDHVLRSMKITLQAQELAQHLTHKE